LWNEVPDHEKIVEHPHFKKFEADLFEIQALQLPPGEIHTAILIKLPAGASIPTHRDAAPHFKLYRRIHLPIVTNPKCLFTVGNQTIHMKAGELWEIDNDTQLHSVVNGGSEDRVHLLIDYFVFPK
jgi:quercetin dioxygenase-like cupin family protein